MGYFLGHNFFQVVHVFLNQNLNIMLATSRGHHANSETELGGMGNNFN